MKQGPALPWTGWLLALFAAVGGVAGYLIWTDSGQRLTAVASPSTANAPKRGAADLEPEGHDADSAGTASSSQRGRIEEPNLASKTSSPIQHDRYGWVGIARDQSGNPVARVSLAWTTKWESISENEVSSDHAGEFFIPFPTELSWSDDDRSGLITLGENWAPILHQVPPPASPPTKVELDLQPAQTWLPVRVLNAGTETPREGLAISLQSNGFAFEAFTDEEGRARMVGQSGINMQLALCDLFAGWLQAPEPLILEPGENPELVVHYQGTPDELQLRAVDHRSGAPIVADWALQTQIDAPTVPLEDHVHEFTWNAEEHGDGVEPCNLQVSAEGYLPTHFEWSETAPDDEAIEVRLEAAHTLELPMRILHGGRAIADTPVRISVNGPFQAEPQTLQKRNNGLAIEVYSGLFLEDQQQSSGRGEFVARLPWPQDFRLPRRVRIEVLHFDWWLDTKQLGPLPWTIDFGPPIERLGFRLVDREGAPVEGQPIHLWFEPDQNSPPLWAARTGPHRRASVRTNANIQTDRNASSDASGEVWFEVPLGVPFLWSTPQNSAIGELRLQPGLAAGENRVIEVSMDERGEVAGRLLRADGREWDGIPLTLELVDAQGNRPLASDLSRPANWSQTRTSWNSGKFSFLSVPPGQYQLRVHPAQMQQADTWVQAGQTELEIPLQAMNRLDLSVVDASTGKRLTGETWAYITHAQGSHSWATIWEGKGVIEFPSGTGLVLELEASGYTASSISLGDFPDGGQRIARKVELHAGREVTLRIAPAEAVEDGRFAGMLVKTSEGEDFAHLPVSYRTDPGVVTLLSLPREALQVWLLERGTRAVLQKVDVPAAPDGRHLEIAVTW